ncbi:MAG: M50 family metallopeptidase, partial [Peptococcaceae bacterium]|nr:M50 family metallopeptidase [Peptococcaceae bacterium]
TIGMVLPALILYPHGRHSLTSGTDPAKMQTILPRGISSLCILLVYFGIAVVVQLIVHEAGHRVCGLLTGYRFLSFRVFRWMIVKRDDTLQLKEFSLKGTMGQCLLVPPDRIDIQGISPARRILSPMPRQWRGKEGSSRNELAKPRQPIEVLAR